MDKKPRVAVLMGGRSAEREVSLMTGKEVSQALREQGYPVTEIDLDQNVVDNLTKSTPDVVFIALHGRLGEDGTVQGMLEILDLPYTGSGVLASALGINKAMSKKIWQSEGIITPPFTVLPCDEYERDKEQAQERLLQEIGLPLVVKPVCEGSTIGMTIVKQKDLLAKALEESFKYDSEAVVERFVEGTEVTVGILGNRSLQALPALEIVSRSGFYDYEAKYTKGMSEHIIPARIPEDQQKKAQQTAVRAHEALDCWGFSRVDLIVTEDGTPYVLEVNTIPGMTSLSLLPDAAKAAGIGFPQLVEKLVELALEK